MSRKRVALTIDEDIFSKFQDEVVAHGYPKSAVSMLVQKFMSDTIKDIEKYGVSPQLELFNLPTGD